MGHHSRPWGRCRLFRSCGRTSRDSTTAAIASLPSVREPGEKCGPMARIPTKADAHSTTVTTIAATPSAFSGAAWPAGAGTDVLAGGGDGMKPKYPGAGAAGWRETATAG